MAASYLHFLLLFSLLVVSSEAADDESGSQISEWCLDCLKRIQPVGLECIPHFSIASAKLCGDYKMIEPFYDDCIKFLNDSMPNVPEDWMTYEACYKDSKCSRECVRAYHNYWGVQCMTILRRPLVCADFGKIHGTGPHTCHTGPTERSEDFILNMTLACGCETVYESREDCLSTPAPVTAAPNLADQTVIIVVACICVLLLALAIVGCIIYLKRQANRSCHTAASTTEVGLMGRTKTDYTSSPQNQPRSVGNTAGTVDESEKLKRDHVYLNTEKPNADV